MESVFEFYRRHEEFFYASQLILAMLGMGATLSLRQFRDILRAPGSIALVLALQFLLMPAVAVALGRVLAMPHEIVVGLVLLMALPSGALSNIMTFLGKGNLPLSITATCASTASCLLITPLVLGLFVARDVADDFTVPLDKTVLSILFLLLLPLAAGMTLGHRWPGLQRPLSRLAVAGSLLILLCIVVGAIGGGRIDVAAYGWRTPAYLVVVVVLSLLFTHSVARLLRYANTDAYTLSIEVALRNGNLGVALCVSLFGPLTESNLLHQGALYVCLFGGGAMVVVGLVAVVRRQMSIARQSQHRG